MFSLSSFTQWILITITLNYLSGTLLTAASFSSFSEVLFYSLVWNIFLSLLICLVFCHYFCELNKTALSPSLEGVALWCSNPCTNYICLMTLVGWWRCSWHSLGVPGHLTFGPLWQDSCGRGILRCLFRGHPDLSAGPEAGAA